MKRIFVLVGVLLMIIMMIPQAQAAGWKTYKDPEGRFSIDYPPDWESMSFFGMSTITPPDSDESVMIMARPTGSDAAISEEEMLATLKAIALAEDPELKGKLKTTKIGGRPAIEYRDPEEGVLFLYTFAKSGNVGYALVFTFTTDPDQFKSANKNYFEPMIKSIKVS
jgi:hypothetical protein